MPFAPATAATATGRFLQRFITMTTNASPPNKYRIGISHATKPKPSLRRLDVRQRAVLLNHGVENLLVVHAGGDVRINFFQHRFRGVARAGIRSADVIALASRLIAAVAHALYLGADLVRAIALIGQQS